MIKSRLAAILILASALIATGSAADADPGARPSPPTVHSPPEPSLTLGLSGAVAQLGDGSPRSNRWTARAEHDGAKIVRLTVDWASVAPASPSSTFDPSSVSSPDYNWTRTDAAVRQLTSEGFLPLIEVGDAPSWAEGANMPNSVASGTWEPNATDFGKFANAISTRYDGHTPDPLHPGRNLPKVTDWQAWNEPNLTASLSPQWEYEGNQVIAESPRIYRDLENAFYRAVKAVSASNYVITAGTAPYGDPPGGARMAPLTFDRKLLCLNADDALAKGCPGATFFDALDDHPYVSGLCCESPAQHAALPDDTSPADMYKIANVLDGAVRARTAAPAGPKQLWATEIGWQTDPPGPVRKGASAAATVGRWATQALYLLWSQGVSTVLWFQLADAPKEAAGWGATLTEGLYYLTGRPKPAAAAFAFPFLTSRKTTTSVETWGRAPRAGTLYIEERQHGRWVSILQLKVTADQVFEAPVALTGSASFRAQIGATTSPTWLQPS